MTNQTNFIYHPQKCKEHNEYMKFGAIILRTKDGKRHGISEQYCKKCGLENIAESLAKQIGKTIEDLEFYGTFKEYKEKYMPN